MARSFNGSSDYIDGGTGTLNIGTSSPYTITTWVNPTAIAGGEVLFSKYTTFPNGGICLKFQNTGKIVLLDGAGSRDSTLGPTTGVWQFIGGACDGTSTFFIVDSTTETAGAHLSDSVSFATNPNTIGSFNNLGNFYSGRLADLAIWNVKLTTNELLALASGVRPYRIRRGNLVAYWPLEGTASPEPDVVGGNNGTLHGTSQVANPYNYTTPKYGSRVFNGSSDKLAASKNGNPTTAISVSAWVNPAGFANTFNCIIARAENGVSFCFKLLTKSTGKVAYYISNGAGNSSVDPGSVTLSAGTWYPLALTYDTTNGLKAYLNGVSDGTDSTNHAALVTSGSQSISIGYDLSNVGFEYNGKIADAAIWHDYVLTATEIAKLAAGFRPYQVRTSGLVAYWPLEGTASPEPDQVFGNNGTLTGTSAGASPTRYQDIVGA